MQKPELGRTCPKPVIGLCVASLLLMLLPFFARAQGLPQFVLDRDWPQLPISNTGEFWLTGGLGGMCMDARDHVFLLNRQDVDPEDLDAALLAPPILEMDASGQVINAWGDLDLIGERLHDCHVDMEGNIWIVAAGTGVLQKYSLQGELLLQIGESGKYDSSDGTRQGQALNSDTAQFFLPSSIDSDAQTGNLYVADGELPGGNARVAVLNPEGEFLFQWQLRREPGEENLTALLHCLRISADGYVYACDRQADRIQVFDRRGNFVRYINNDFEVKSSPENRLSGERGTAVVLAFSNDPQQEYMYVINQNSMQIDIFNRLSGQKLGSFGEGPGTYPGQFILPHSIAVDSQGNIIIAEQAGKRVQKFLKSQLDLAQD